MKYGLLLSRQIIQVFSEIYLSAHKSHIKPTIYRNLHENMGRTNPVNPNSAGIDFIRQILTTEVDPRTVRI